MSSKTRFGAPDIRRTALEQIKNKVLLSPEDLGRYRQLRNLHRVAAAQSQPREVPFQPQRPAADRADATRRMLEPCLTGLQLAVLERSDSDQFQRATEDAVQRATQHLGRPLDAANPQHCVRLRREFLQSLTAARYAAVSESLDEVPFSLRDRVRETLFHSMRHSDRNGGRDPATWDAGHGQQPVSFPDLILAMAATFLEAQDQGADRGVADVRIDAADRTARERQARSRSADSSDEQG